MSVVDGLPFAEEKKDYILKTLDPILEEMVSDVLAEMPNVPMDFMIQWLIKRTGRAADATERVSVFQKNHNLKQELRYLQGSLEEASTAAAAPAEEEEEEEDDDDDCDEIPESFRKSEESMGKTRTSVSAEAYGTWNQKKAFTPPDHPKTDEQKQRLKQTLSKSFMFSSLEDKDMTTILGAMKECKFAAGQKVINEGDNGDFPVRHREGTAGVHQGIQRGRQGCQDCERGRRLRRTSFALQLPSRGLRGCKGRVHLLGA